MRTLAPRPRAVRRLAAMAAAGSLALASVPGMAQAAPPPDLQSPGASPLAFASSKVTTIHGTRDGGDCTLWLTGQVDPASTPTFGAALSKVDSANCTATVTSGKVSAVRGTPADQARAGAGADTPSSQSLMATGLSHRTGDLKAWAEDIAGLDLNNVHARVAYDYNGTRNWNALGAGCNGSWWWLSNTGWFRTNQGYFCQYEDNYTRVHSSTYGTYQNNAFCATFNVTNGYARANLWGNGNGTLNYTVGWQVNRGNCPLPINGAYVTVSAG